MYNILRPIQAVRGMQYITEYISDNYMTLMLLTGLAVILLANRRTKIEGTQYV